MLPLTRLFLCFKSIFKIIYLFNFILVFSDRFDMLMSEINFKK
jgi:hypothetical protein